MIYLIGQIRCFLYLKLKYTFYFFLVFANFILEFVCLKIIIIKYVLFCLLTSLQVMKRQGKAFLGFSTSKQDKIYTFFTLLLLLIFFIKIMNLQCCLYAIFTNYCFHFIKHCNLSIKSVMDYTRKTDIISILILLILIFWCSEVNIH